MIKKHILALLALSISAVHLNAIYIVSGTINPGEAVKIEFCNKEGWCKLSYTNFYIKEKFLLKLEEEGVYIVDDKSDELVYTYELEGEKNKDSSTPSNAGKQIINEIVTKNKHLPKVRRETPEERQERENISKLVGILKFSTLIQVRKCDKFGWCQLEKTGYFVRRDNIKPLDVENIYMVDTEDTRMYNAIPKDVNTYNNLGDLQVVRLYKVEDERRKAELISKLRKDYWVGFDIGYGSSSVSSVDTGGLDKSKYELTEQAKALNGGFKYSFDTGYAINKKYSVGASFEGLAYGTFGIMNNVALACYSKNVLTKDIALNLGALLGVSYLTWQKDLGNSQSSFPGSTSTQFLSGVVLELTQAINSDFEYYGSYKLYFTEHRTSGGPGDQAPLYVTSAPSMLSLGIRYFF